MKKPLLYVLIQEKCAGLLRQKEENTGLGELIDISSILILIMSLLIIVDRTDSTWVLYVILLLGVFLNAFETMEFYRRKRKARCAIHFLMALASMGTFIYLLV